jgi:ABC-type transporter Mla subunit MlaD
MDQIGALKVNVARHMETAAAGNEKLAREYLENAEAAATEIRGTIRDLRAELEHDRKSLADAVTAKRALFADLRELVRKLKFESTEIDRSTVSDVEEYSDGYLDGYNFAEVDTGHELESVLCKYGFEIVEREDENEG